MKINEHVALSTPKVLLVPYCGHHVPTYHEWMKDPELQAATASEPLSLDEEYDMQQSWRADCDKLTFIICLPPLVMRETVTPELEDAPGRMVGDINLFLFEADEDEQSVDISISEPGLVGELELMIARQDMQRRGHGRAALLAFMDYILSRWNTIADEYRQDNPVPGSKLQYLRVRINQTNTGSIALFESLAFERTASGPNHFGEVELRWKPTSNVVKSLAAASQACLLRYTSSDA